MKTKIFQSEISIKNLEEQIDYYVTDNNLNIVEIDIKAHAINRGKASFIDYIAVLYYEEHIEESLDELVDRMELNLN